MVSFGQGCEGEPLTRWKEIARAIRLIRSRTRRGSIHANTNGSLPEALGELIAAGLDSIRVSLNSASPDLYGAYYRPTGYGLEDVVRSIRLARRRGVYVALNLLTFPGVTDRAGETERLCRLVASTGVDQVQTRPLAIDPDLYMEHRARPRGGRASRSGSRRSSGALRRARPGLVGGQLLPRARGARPPGGRAGGTMTPGVDAELPLRKDLARHLRAGHPWVFRRAVEQAPSRLPAGSIVDVTEDGRFVARGYYDPLSAISVRILTREAAEAIDAAFWRRRVARALALRRELVSGTNAYRLVHGEGDGLPGVIVDRYDRFAVLKLYSAGLTPHRPAIVEAVRAEAEGLAGVFGRDEVGRDDDDEEGEAPRGRGGRVLWGAEPPERIAVRRARHDAARGRAPRPEDRPLPRPAREPPHGARAGPRAGRGAQPLRLHRRLLGGGGAGRARHVVTVDVDRDAIALARENFRANGLDPADHAFAAEDCFEILGRYRKEGRRFDLVVCDPPAFAKSQKAVEGALSGYASLNRAALAVLAPGGLLVTASCSARVSAEQFSDAVKEAAFKARVELALVAETRQPPDHPVSLQFREGRYLKCMVLRRAS